MRVSVTALVRRSTPGCLNTWVWRRSWVVALAVLGLALLACGADPATPTTPPTVGPTQIIPPSETPSVNVDRISYVSPEGDLFTINSDGSNVQQLTGGSPQVQSGPTGGYLTQPLNFDNFYAWPTWSPDGTKLAASLVQLTDNRSTEVSVQVLDAVTGRNRTVFENDIGRLIADGTPHYLYWAPDSNTLGILASTQQGLSLFAADLESPDSLAVLETGAPLYFNWSGDGNSLLIHVGAEVKLLQKPFDGAKGQVLASAGGFRVAALSPEGNQLAYPEADPTGGQLMVASVAQPRDPQAALEIGANSAILWSPQGGDLAVADQTNPNSLIFERLRLVSADGSGERTLVEEPLIAFYWSPDGQKLAWVALDTSSRVFEWKVIGRDGSGQQDLFRFQPTSEVLTMLSFFDQYAHSHSPWSPDSSHLVVAGTREPVSERRNGHTPTGAQVFVVDVTGTQSPREIASGTLAFWSWN
ncbi:MAG: TolB family protein [Dehalococcoidia bacterium]